MPRALRRFEWTQGLPDAGSHTARLCTVVDFEQDYVDGPPPVALSKTRWHRVVRLDGVTGELDGCYAQTVTVTFSSHKLVRACRTSFENEGICNGSVGGHTLVKLN